MTLAGTDYFENCYFDGVAFLGIWAVVFALQDGAQQHLQTGMSLAARGEQEAAIEPLRKACQLAPQLEDACYFHGRNLFALGRYEEAIAPLAVAIRSGPGSKLWRVHRAAAMNFQALGRPVEAERHYRDAMRLSEDGGLRVDFGAFLFRQGRTKEAVEPLRSALDGEASARAHGELGRVLLQLGKLEDAARHLEIAVAKAPKNWPLRLLLGRTYIQLGQAEAGERELRIARQGLEGSTTSR